MTPIVKAKKGNKQLAFYTMPQYEEWKEQIGDEKGWTIKYLKVCPLRFALLEIA